MADRTLVGYEADSPSDADVVAAPGAAKQIYLEKLTVVTLNAGSVQVSVGADAAATRLVNADFAANGGVVLDFGAKDPLRLGANVALKATSDVAGLKVTAVYQIGAV